jgi:DamX protein
MDETPDESALPDQIASLTGALAQQKLELLEAKLWLELLDAKVSLGSRIADLDDSRRETETRLESVLRARHDELAAKLKYQARMLAGGIVVLALLLGIVLFSDRRSAPPLPAADESVQETLAGLQASLADLSEWITRDELQPSPQMTNEIAVRDSSPVSPPDVQAPVETSSLAPADPLVDRSDPERTLDTADPAVTAFAADPTEAPAAPAVADPAALGADDVPGNPDLDTVMVDADPAATRDATEQEIAAAPATPPAERDERDEQPILVGERQFALQLMGFYSMDAMRQFAGRARLPSRVYFREERYRGRPWFVLIHSLYPTQSDALAAMTTLPAELAGLDVWVRNLSPEARLAVLDTD